jgi:hypothetical protein
MPTGPTGGTLLTPAPGSARRDEIIPPSRIPPL